MTHPIVTDPREARGAEDHIVRANGAHGRLVHEGAGVVSNGFASGAEIWDENSADAMLVQAVVEVSEDIGGLVNVKMFERMRAPDAVNLAENGVPEVLKHVWLDFGVNIKAEFFP